MIRAIIIDDEDHCIDTLSLQLKEFLSGPPVFPEAEKNHS